jgi:hypothetical protein
MKILDFFLFLWVIFALLDPDPDPATQINGDPCGSGSGYGSETLCLTIYVPHSYDYSCRKLLLYSVKRINIHSFFLLVPGTGTYHTYPSFGQFCRPDLRISINEETVLILIKHDPDPHRNVTYNLQHYFHVETVGLRFLNRETIK